MAPAVAARTGTEKLEWRSADESPDVAVDEAAVERTMKEIERRRRTRSRGTHAALLACALLASSGAPAGGVVHTTGDGSGNTTAPTPPAEDPGFANVGATGSGLSGVYLGNRWVLTAGHVGEQSIKLGGITYPPIAGSRVQLQHSPGVFADLALVRLVSAPPLPPLVLASAPPGVGNNVTMIGNGWNRQPGQTCWNESFVEVSCGPPPPDFRGYKQLGGAHIVRWGRNLVTDVAMDVQIGSTMTRAFQVDFDESGVTDEAQAVIGDSGGAAFLKRGSQWELVGVLFAIEIFAGQPYTSTVVFGQGTLSVDVAHYRAQIEAIMNPPPQIPALPWPALALAAAALAVAASRKLRPR